MCNVFGSAKRKLEELRQEEMAKLEGRIDYKRLSQAYEKIIDEYKLVLDKRISEEDAYLNKPCLKDFIIND